MRYSSIRKMDISNGEHTGVSLFVQGCHFHCYNCFNSDTWDFNGGKLWTPDVEDSFMELMKPHFIKRVSILGGEPLESCNLNEILLLAKRIKTEYPDMKIWIYSGYTFDKILYNADWKVEIDDILRKGILKYTDIMVDGQFNDSLKDLNLKWKGSANQRVIDVQETLYSIDESSTIPDKKESEKTIKDWINSKVVLYS